MESAAYDDARDGRDRPGAADVSIPQPTPDEARAAVAEAAAAQDPVRNSDRVFAPRLLALAAATVGLTALISVFTVLPAWMGPIEGLLAGLGLTGAVVLVVSAQMRQHAYARAGNRLFAATPLVWIVWAEIVFQGSFRSNWMAYGLPHLVRMSQFVLSSVIAVVPLLVGAILFGGRR